MLANHPVRKITHAVLAGASLMLLGSCSADSGAKRPVSAPPPPRPQPSANQPSATPRPLPPVAAPLRRDWQDAPVSPGDWRWGIEGGKSVARFAGGALVLTCDRAAATVTLSRQGAVAGQGAVPMTVLTTSLTRPLSATPMAGPPATVAAALPAGDALLDAMAFSRGRFAVEVAGLPTITVPSWTEVSRVVEDCR